jgi:mannose-1-phosphate guanylyltransferase
MSLPRVTYVIMAGGGGERLWPLVRRTRPKVCLAPTGARTLLQATVDRLRPVVPGPEWLIVTTKDQAAAVRATLPAALRSRVVVEPQIRNTAACLTLAAAMAAHRRPGGVVVALPADHWIPQPAGFRTALRAAITAAAREQAIVTIGVTPREAHTGMGYIQAGPGVSGRGRGQAFRIARFIEKPTKAVARRLIRRPRTYWNSGIFVGRADVFLEAAADWLPGHAAALRPLGSVRPSAIRRRAAAAYRRVRPISFDHGIMVRLPGQRRALVVEGRFQWADLGSWDALARLAPPSRTVAVDSANVSVISHDGHLVAAVGVSDVVVVHTPSATLICRADQAQGVRSVVQRIKADPSLAAYR